MVAPLDVHAVVVQQGVHYHVCPWPPVEDIAHNMEMIHRHPLNDLAHGLNKAGGLVDVDDGVDDIFIVVPFVRLVIMGMEQLIDDIGVVLGQSFPDLGPGIFGGYPAAYLDETM